LTCPALIDFEASCLPEYGQSFPIEVAIARIDGRSAAWLIRPAEAWKYWDWSDEAEALHGISRELLEREGLPLHQVLAEMRQFVHDCDVYADADLDEYWLEVLCQAAGEKLPFPVRYLGELLKKRGYTRGQVVSALEEAKRRLPREHLAREDAKRLAMAIKLLLDMPPQGLSY
jgi:DNA polymerase III, epsilon subunit and related 3''-5'' exonucleases